MVNNADHFTSPILLFKTVLSCCMISNMMHSKISWPNNAQTQLQQFIFKKIDHTFFINPAQACSIHQTWIPLIMDEAVTAVSGHLILTKSSRTFSKSVKAATITVTTPSSARPSPVVPAATVRVRRTKKWWWGGSCQQEKEGCPFCWGTKDLDHRLFWGMSKHWMGAWWLLILKLCVLIIPTRWPLSTGL